MMWHLSTFAMMYVIWQSEHVMRSHWHLAQWTPKKSNVLLCCSDSDRHPFNVFCRTT